MREGGRVRDQGFPLLKRLIGFAKLRFRGLVKHAGRACALPAWTNPDKWGHFLAGRSLHGVRNNGEAPRLKGPDCNIDVDGATVC